VARFGRGRGRFSRGPQRQMKWCGAVIDGELDTASSQSAQYICTEEEALQLTQPTVVRIRGNGYVSATFAAGAGGFSSAYVHMGIMVVTDALSVPNPAEQVAWPWLWWRTVYLTTRNQVWPIAVGDPPALSTATTVAAHAGDHFDKFDVDVKAMRKIPTGSALVFVVRFTAEDLSSPADAVSWHAGFRALLKE